VTPCTPRDPMHRENASDAAIPGRCGAKFGPVDSVDRFHSPPGPVVVCTVELASADLRIPGGRMEPGPEWCGPCLAHRFAVSS
jgi:hypothetical protein